MKACVQCLDPINFEFDTYYDYKCMKFCSLGCLVAYLRDNGITRLVRSEAVEKCAACGEALEPVAAIVEYTETQAKCCDYGCLCDYLFDVGDLR